MDASAPSDGPNMLRLDAMAGFLDDLKRLDEIAKARPRAA